MTPRPLAEVSRSGSTRAALTTRDRLAAGEAPAGATRRDRASPAPAKVYEQPEACI
jgi:hypothetical protein